jgi:hypothetical protein
MTFRKTAPWALLAGAVVAGGCVSAQSTPGQIVVPEGGNLQRALDQAVPGDTVILTAGATYRGNFILRKKSGEGTITITTSATLPGDAERIDPVRHGALLARLVTPNVEAALRTENGAHSYTIRGIEFTADPKIYVYDMIKLGPLQPTKDEDLGYNFELDHVYVHGSPDEGGKRGVMMHSSSVLIKNSHIGGFFSKGQETYAIGCWSGRGPYYIWNNFLEASGIHILFGGQAPRIQGLTPENIEVFGNHFSRPETWRGVYAVKNFFEIKHGRNVAVRYNVFERNWASAQDGFGILFTVRTCEAGNYPWSVVENVDFSYNVVRDSEGGGVNILGQDYFRAPCAENGTGTVTTNGKEVLGAGTKFTEELKATDRFQIGSVFRIVAEVIDDQRLTLTQAFPEDVLEAATFKRYAALLGRVSDITVRNNLFEGIHDSKGVGGRLFQMTQGPKNVVFEYNTGFAGNTLISADGAATTGLVFRYNVVTHGRFGILGTGVGTGQGTISRYFPDGVFEGNVIHGTPASLVRLYPQSNFFPVTTAEVGFVDVAARNYQLSSASPFHGKAGNGRDPGADIVSLTKIFDLVTRGISVQNLATPLP